MQCLTGCPIYSNFLSPGKEPELPHGPLAFDDELWADMEHGLHEAVHEAARIRLRKCMPAAVPYTFTHSDLTNINIMVEYGHLTGIIGWEIFGFSPVW